MPNNKNNNQESTMPNNANNNNQESTVKTSPPKRAAFDKNTRANTESSFNVAVVADIGLKALVATTCGVMLYKTLSADS